MKTKTKVHKVLMAYSNDGDIYSDDADAAEACEYIDWDSIKGTKNTLLMTV